MQWPATVLVLPLFPTLLLFIKKRVPRSVADPDDFWPDPDPIFENVRIQILTLINLRPTFFWTLFWWKYALKSTFMDQKVKQHWFLKYLWLLHTPKKLIQSHLSRSGSRSGSGPRRPDPQHWCHVTPIWYILYVLYSSASSYYFLQGTGRMNEKCRNQFIQKID
jgi:hypothetical protein